jgi:hypothetical protein
MVGSATKEKKVFELKRFFFYTVILVRPKTGESAELSFAPKFVGDYFSIWADLLIWRKFAQIRKISPVNFRSEMYLRGFAHFEQVSPKKLL